MKQTKYIFALAFGVILASCGKGRPDVADITVLYTTDIHGLVLPTDFTTDHPAATSLANVSTYVGRVRTERPDGVVLLDAGDWCVGQPSMYYYNYVDVYDGHLLADAFNYLGYDAVGIGSSDIELGAKLYRERLPQQFKMPIVNANIVTNSLKNSRPAFRPYTIIERQGVRIAVLGLTRADIDKWVPRSLWRGLELEKMRTAADKWAQRIRETEHPDVLIGLFHSGSGLDADSYETAEDSTRAGNASIPTAALVGGFDLVLFGHDHQSHEGTYTDRDGHTFAALEPLPRTAEVGRADLHLTLQTDGTYKVEVRTERVPMQDVPVDEQYVTHFADATRRVNAYLDTPLGTLADSLYAARGLVGPSAGTDFVHNMQLWVTAADVSLTNFSLSHDVTAGEFTTRDLFAMYQYDNQISTLHMTGREIDRFLEFGFARQFNQMHSADDHLLRFNLDENGEVKRGAFGPELYVPQYRFSSAAGIRYTVDVTRPEGDRVEIEMMSDSTAFDPDATYVVAINSHQLAGGGGYLPEGLGWTQDTVATRLVSTDPTDLRLLFANYIRLHKDIDLEPRHDWRVVPAEWTIPAGRRDILLFGDKFSR